MKALERDWEAVFTALGDFGPYQKRQVVLYAIAAILGGMNMMCLVTIAGVPLHRCYIPEIDSEYENDTRITNKYLPTGTPDLFRDYVPFDERGAMSSCQKYDTGPDRTRIGCDRYVYDNTYYTQTLVTKFDMVCERSWMGSVMQSSYIIGTMVSAISLGILGDKFGRKMVFCMSAVITLFLSIICAFVQGFYWQLLLRFLIGGFFNSGCYSISLVLTAEVIGKSRRGFCMGVMGVSYCIGVVVDAVWGLWIHDAFDLQLVYGLHVLLIIGHWWLMDESPRWLISRQRIRDAEQILDRALKLNGKDTRVLYDTRLTEINNSTTTQSPNEPSPSIWNLFRTPNLRKKTLIILYAFCANSLAVFGVSFSTNGMKGNPFILMALMGAAEIPADICVGLAMNRVGRRPITSGLMLVGALCCLASGFMTPETTTTLIVVLLAKFCTAGSFVTLSNYFMELFPTNLRTSAAGLCYMWGRFFIMVASFVLILSTVNTGLPLVIFGISILVSALLILFLPETTNQILPETVEDAELFGKGDTCFSRRHNVNLENRKAENNEKMERF